MDGRPPSTTPRALLGLAPAADPLCRATLGALLQSRRADGFSASRSSTGISLLWVPISAAADLDRLSGARSWRMNIDPVPLAVFIFFFALVTVMGFVAARWRVPENLASIDEWGLGGRQFGTWITWFLVGGDFYTAYTVIAVPALVYAVGAYGFFALPYTIIVYPFVFAVMPRLWQVARDRGYATSADVVHGTLQFARARACGRGHRRDRDDALHRAAADRHGGGDQGARPHRRDPADHRLRYSGALHLFVGPARAGADRFRQRHHDLHRGDRGGRHHSGEARRLWRDFRCRGRRLQSQRLGRHRARARAVLSLCLARSRLGARRLHVSAHADRHFRQRAAATRSARTRSFCRPTRCCSGLLRCSAIWASPRV